MKMLIVLFLMVTGAVLVGLGYIQRKKSAQAAESRHKHSHSIYETKARLVDRDAKRRQAIRRRGYLIGAGLLAVGLLVSYLMQR